MNKMKNIILLTFALLAMVIISCDDEVITSYNEKYVAFSVPTAALQEGKPLVSADGIAIDGPNTLEVSIIRSSIDASQPITITISKVAQFTTESPFASAGDDASSSFLIGDELAQVTIPAGEYIKKVSLASIPDVLSSGNKTLKLEITGVSDPTYNIGVGPSAIRKSFILTVNDDDCPINLIQDWEGTYEVTSICAPEGATNEGLCFSDIGLSTAGLDVTLTADPSDPSGTTAILSGGIHVTPLIIKFITCESEVEFSGINEIFGGFAIRPSNAPAVYGVSTYQEASKRITLVTDLTEPGGGPNYDEFIVEYVKK